VTWQETNVQDSAFVTGLRTRCLSIGAYISKPQSTQRLLFGLLSVIQLCKDTGNIPGTSEYGLDYDLGVCDIFCRFFGSLKFKGWGEITINFISYQLFVQNYENYQRICSFLDSHSESSHNFSPLFFI
jgi:hypothetical protein